MQTNRRYMGFDIVPNADTTGAAPGVVLPWRTNCPTDGCSWSYRGYQSEIREAIKYHRWPGQCPVKNDAAA